MTRNTFGGSKHKKVKRGNRNKIGIFDEKNGNYYAKVLKLHGGNRINVHLHDGREIDIIIPGKYRKRVWVKKNDLICCTEYEMKWKVETEGEKYKASKYFVDKSEDTYVIFDNYEKDDKNEDLNQNFDDVIFGNPDFNDEI